MDRTLPKLFGRADWSQSALFWRLIIVFTYFLFFMLASQAGEGNGIQRIDGCAVIEVKDNLSKEGELEVFFKIANPGTYSLQLVHSPEAVSKDVSASASVNGASIGTALIRSYWIEDGLVSNFQQPVKLDRAGGCVVRLKCSVPPDFIRLIPALYEKSRIMVGSQKYYDEWITMNQSPEKQAAMKWYQQAKFGMFIHWGVYSQAAGSWKGVKIEDSDIKGPRVAEWLMYTFQISRAEYREYAKEFHPEKSFAQNIAQLAKKTGMKYVVITAKHHDGFALFDSAHSDWDIADSTPYDGDLIKELYAACRSEGLDFGVYYSHGHDWMDGCDANYAKVKKKRDEYGVPTRPNGKNFWDPSEDVYEDYLEKKAYAQIIELVKMMPDLRLIWFDGDGLITEKQAFRFYKTIYDLNPNIIINRRVGYEYGDYMDAGDNRTPAAGELAPKYFETCGTANHSWGFKAYDQDWKSTDQLLRNFVDIISKGGNYLLNIGPDGKGVVPAPCVENFEGLGKWVKTNGEAVYGTTRWKQFSENVNPKKGAENKPGEFWFSAKGNKVYAMSITPATETVRIKSLGKKEVGALKKLRLLGSDHSLEWTQTEDALRIDFSGIQTSDQGFVIEVETEP